MICCDVCKAQIDVTKVKLVEDDSPLGNQGALLAEAEVCAKCKDWLSVVLKRPYELHEMYREYERRHHERSRRDRRGPRRFRARLPAWAIAREAAVQIPLDHAEEMKLRTSLEKVVIVIEVQQGGAARVVGSEQGG